MTGTAAKRWLLYLAWLGLATVLLLQDGLDAATLCLLGALALIAAAGWYIATRVARPWRSYFAVALGSACLAALFVSLRFTIVALAFWLVLTLLALTWAWYWEWTEPLPGSRSR